MSGKISCCPSEYRIGIRTFSEFQNFGFRLAPLITTYRSSVDPTGTRASSHRASRRGRFVAGYGVKVASLAVQWVPGPVLATCLVPRWSSGFGTKAPQQNRRTGCFVTRGPRAAEVQGQGAPGSHGVRRSARLMNPVNGSWQLCVNEGNNAALKTCGEVRR